MYVILARNLLHDGLPHVGWESKIGRFNQLVTRDWILTAVC